MFRYPEAHPELFASYLNDRFPFVVVGWILHRLFLLIRIVVCLFDYQLDMTPFHLFCHYT